jgi:hypothetical protein
MTPKQHKVMQMALAALENHAGNYKLSDKGLDKHERACDSLRAELNKSVCVIMAYQSESKPSDILSVEDYENIDPIWHWMYRPLYAT